MNDFTEVIRQMLAEEQEKARQADALFLEFSRELASQHVVQMNAESDVHYGSTAYMPPNAKFMGMYVNAYIDALLEKSRKYPPVEFRTNGIKRVAS